MTSTRLSIIIPCYNSSKTLKEAVDSCYVQGLSDSDFEIIMVDDGSTDTTPEIMKKYAEHHSNIRNFFHLQNKGGGAARNTAASHALYPIIFCLDSDDILPEGTLSKMLSFMLEKKCDGVGIHHSIKFIGEDTHNIEFVQTFSYAGEKIPFISLLQKNNISCSLYSTFMIRKDVFDTIGGYPSAHGFDTQGIAWRFLAAGFIAYTCPDSSYLHRTHFNESYYLREAAAGKTNYNWQEIFIEHLNLFDHDTQKFIINFNCKDFSKNLYDEIRMIDNPLRTNYTEFIGKSSPEEIVHLPEKIYIKRNSLQGIAIRIKSRIKKNNTTYKIAAYFFALYSRTKRLITGSKERKKYYKQIAEIKMQKKIVVELSFGGIGDCLMWSTLPRLLKETHGIDFYLSKKSLNKIRQHETLELCFEMNPYFKGVSCDEKTFSFKFFDSERGLYSFITDKRGKNNIEILENQFNLKGMGIPEIFYKPQFIDKYKNIILIDENMISGKKLGYKFKRGAFINEALRHKRPCDTIEYVDPQNQNLFTYVDMIYSCRHFVATFSGGASIAACIKKPFSVIFPYNALNGTTFLFRYTNSQGSYIK